MSALPAWRSPLLKGWSWRWTFGLGWSPAGAADTGHHHGTRGTRQLGPGRGGSGQDGDVLGLVRDVLQAQRPLQRDRGPRGEHESLELVVTVQVDHDARAATTDDGEVAAEGRLPQIGRAP